MITNKAKQEWSQSFSTESDERNEKLLMAKAFEGRKESILKTNEALRRNKQAILPNPPRDYTHII